MDVQPLQAFVDRLWDDEVVPQLADYVRIPAKSPAFDPDWAAHGHIDRAVAQYEAWARAKLAGVAGATVEVLRLEGRTPLLLIDVPGEVAGTVLMYGHLDKQPEATGWDDGHGPWDPVVRDGRLYGRGSADDGYALFGHLSALLAVRAAGGRHARCVALIEACEESGSYDLPAYLELLSDRLGAPELVVCLDSGCGDYDTVWLTTSLRGMVGGVLSVEVLTEGVHSGDASGIVPSSFRILRQLLSRLEDEATGAILPAEFHVEVPAQRAEQARAAAAALGAAVWDKFPFVAGMSPVSPDGAELLLNKAWRPALAVTGLAGAPDPAAAGNVLRPGTHARLSLRLPPTADAEAASQALKILLERDPPYGAHVRFEVDKAGTGWNAPAMPEWLDGAIHTASRAVFGRDAAAIGEGGSIPLMGLLAERFPGAQFLVTGVLGPHSNAHGPNEFLHIGMGKAVSVAVAAVLASHGARTEGD